MRLIEFSVKNPVFSNLLMATIIIFGFYIGKNLPKELFPSIGFERVTIVTIYENSTAEDVEKLITIPIEDQISGISGIKKITSSSSESRSFIVAELLPNEDIKEIAQEIRSEVSQIRNDLPDDIDDPITEEVEASAPLINVSIGSKGDENELRFYATKLKDRLEKLDEIDGLIESGYGDLVFWINIDQKKLLQYELSLNEIISTIQSKNIDLPAGAIETGEQEYTIRTKGRIENVYELENIPLNKRFNKIPLVLGDIADIELGQEKDLSLSRINGFKSVSFWIEKQKNKDAIKSVQKIKDTVSTFEETIPDDIKIFISNDSSYWVEGRFESMVKTGVFGIMAVLIILALFLDFRSAFLAALGLPVAFFGAFIVMQYTGASLNVITMFGLIMVLGIVVDDAIIVVENVKRHIQKGLKPKDAAIIGTKEVAWPVIATILTNNQIKEFIKIAEEIGLDCIIEVHSSDELKRVLPINYPIIGVNNRNLDTLSIDTDNTSKLIKNISDYFTIIAESGIKNYSDIKNYNKSGIYNFLIGESILRSENKELKFKELLNK